MTPAPHLRQAVIARMTDKHPNKVLGRTALMKLLYFLEEIEGVNLNYDFRMFTYGPFDSDVLHDIGTAGSSKVVHETIVTYPRGYGYEIRPAAGAAELSEELADKHPDIAAKVDRLVECYGTMLASELELRSTILYVDRDIRRRAQSSDIDTLVNLTRKIKPHFTAETVGERVREMSKNQQLYSLTDARF